MMDALSECNDISDDSLLSADLICMHGELDFPAPPNTGACMGTEFDITWGEKGVVRVTCKKCGAVYRLTPYLWVCRVVKKRKKSKKEA